MSLLFANNMTSVSVYEGTDCRKLVGWIDRPGSHRAPNSSMFAFMPRSKDARDVETIYCSTREEAKQAALAHYVAMRMTQ